MSEEIGNLLELVIAGEWGNNQGTPGGIDTKVIRSANFTKDHQFNSKEIVFRSIEERKRHKKLLRKGDILIEKSGGSPDQPVGRVLFYDLKGEITCSNFISILRPSQQVEARFLYYSLCNLYERGVVKNYQQQTTGIINLQLGEYLRESIYLPPLPEQKKIAEILSGIDNNIRILRLKKEKVTLAKSATSLHIFKSPKDSEQTAIQVSDLQSLASIPISYGVLVPDKATRDEGVPMIKIQDINLGKIQTERLSYISKALHNKYAKTEVKTGDLLISLIGSIGITARVPDALQGANVSRQFAVIRTSSLEMSNYLYCFLGGAAAQERISFLSQGNAQKALNLDSLRSLEVPLRSNAEMDRVVRICQALDLIIESVSKQIDKAEKIRVSVASDLLSGRKRVSV
jgi:type I restriction enzyme S subunit